MRIDEGADRVREGMDDAEPLLEAHPGHQGGERELRPHVRVLLVIREEGEVLRHARERLSRDARDDRVENRRGQLLDEVSEDVHGATVRDAHGAPVGQRGIDDRGAGNEPVVRDQGLPDHVPALRRDEGAARHLAPRARGRRNGDHPGEVAKDPRPRRLPVVVVRDGRIVSGEEAHRLRGHR